MKREALLLATLCGLTSSPVWALDLGLQKDPFARPGYLATGDATASGSDASAAAWPPKLSAVMVAGRESMVMIDNRRLRLGDEIDGYRLRQVLPRQAVFLKEGRRFVVDILPPPSKNEQKRGQE